MKYIELAEIKKKLEAYTGKKVSVAGWIKTIRSSKDFSFIEINDGSCFANTQVVLEKDKIKDYERLIKLKIGSSIIIEGIVINTPNQKQTYELNANNINLEGDSDDDFPLQKKRHSLEFLREIAHLRPRSNIYRAVFKVRSEAFFAIHNYFNKKNFVCVNTPIITGSDCEGAGEMFKVTTLDLNNIPRNNKGDIDYTKDFFGKESNLSVSGQLNVETFAMAYSKVYTFGPTFRAENSNTSRHASEFWMLEPEIAFADLNDNIELAQDMLKYLVKYVLDNCKEEIVFLDNFVEKGLIERLNQFLNSEFKRISYTEAVDIIKKNIQQGKAPKFEYPLEWGDDLKSEHERYLTEQVFKGPVTVTDYPKDIKAFYMRLNDDKKTVAAMDLLVPGVGEMIGGSQREERLDYLTKRIESMGLNAEDYGWYLDLRKYGTTRHAGFGLGFDRFLMYVTGINNIKDTIPFPRTPKNSKY